MPYYEILIENMTPCGGEQHAIRELVETEAESPMAYVMANKLFPDVESHINENGETVITASNPVGYKTRYTFT